MIGIKDLEFYKLKNDYCTLSPLSYEHQEDLIKAASDGELWHLPYATIPKPEAMKAEIRRRIDLEAEGAMLPFTVIHNDTKRVVGMTTFCKINVKDKEVDIGWTWYARSHQQTVLNTNCKLLLLTYALETLDFYTVYFKVHTKNQRSQAAVLRLGAKWIGTIKNYCTMPGKKAQDYYHYAIYRADWPELKQKLLIRERNIPRGTSK